MRKFSAKFWQIKFNNIQKKVKIQHGQVRFIQKHKLGLTFEIINQYNLPSWDERRKKHDYLKRYRKSSGRISASVRVKIISINIRRKIPRPDKGHPWKHGGSTVSGPYGVTPCSFHPHTDAGAPQSTGLSQTCGCQVGWQGGGKAWEFGVSRGKLLYRDGETPQVLLK